MRRLSQKNQETLNAGIVRGNKWTRQAKAKNDRIGG
jgi:hypothetical protein